MKLPAVHETEIYVNRNGHLVVKQDHYPEEPVFVVLPKAYALMLAKEIKRLVADGSLTDTIASEEVEAL